MNSTLVREYISLVWKVVNVNNDKKKKNKKMTFYEVKMPYYHCWIKIDQAGEDGGGHEL